MKKKQKGVLFMKQRVYYETTCITRLLLKSE